MRQKVLGDLGNRQTGMHVHIFLPPCLDSILKKTLKLDSSSVQWKTIRRANCRGLFLGTIADFMMKLARSSLAFVNWTEAGPPPITSPTSLL